MGILASTVIEAGGEVIGVMPRQLANLELLHDGLTTTHIVETMHERKALMAKLSSGFISLPGGFGTLEECCEMLTWAQLNIHEKPCGILNCFGFLTDYWDSLTTKSTRGSSRQKTARSFFTRLNRNPYSP